MKLLLLRCPKCNYALEPGQRDRVIQCPNCRAAVGIYDGGLDLPATFHARSSVAHPLHWLPFWVYGSRVTILQRKTQGGRSAEKESQEFWGRPRQVYIPAWDISLLQARDMVSSLLRDQPPLEAVDPPEGATFEPAITTREDGRKLLELVIVSIEAERQDWMESLEYDLQLEGEALWLLPAAKKKDDGWDLLLPKR